MAFPMGSVLGFTLPAMIVGELNPEDDPDSVRRRILLYIWIQCFFVTVSNITLLIFVQEKPPSPPSLSATQPPVPFDF